MANPVIVNCAAGVWTKVATNVTSATISIKDKGGEMVAQTYVMTGTTAPTGLTSGIPVLGLSYSFINSLGSDIYIYSQSKASDVRVDS